MTGERRRFTVSAPDWGQDHLSPDAIVAFVDNELAERPCSRAAQHIDGCHECAARVRAQAQARSAIRSAQCPTLPSSLLSSLRSIPLDADLPAAPDGLAMTPDGQFVTVLRPQAPVPARLPVPMQASASQAPAAQVVAARRPSNHRRMRLGAGAAVSGLALGALALGASGIASAPAVPAGPTDRGVFNGSVLGGGPGGVVDARLRIVPPSSQPGRP